MDDPNSKGHNPKAPRLFAVTQKPLDSAPMAEAVAGADMGAIVTFAGVVRNNFAGRSTAYLEYEAYALMAESVLAQLAAEAQARWGTGAIAIHHRIGRLEIGETAVLIVVAAPHRHEAFEAAEQIMDRIKQVAPIWKKEVWADGASEWVGSEDERKAALAPTTDDQRPTTDERPTADDRRPMTND